MTQGYGNTGGDILVAIDVAKKHDAVLVQFPDGSRKKFTVPIIYEITGTFLPI